MNKKVRWLGGLCGIAFLVIYLVLQQVDKFAVIAEISLILGVSLLMIMVWLGAFVGKKSKRLKADTIILGVICEMLLIAGLECFGAAIDLERKDASVFSVALVDNEHYYAVLLEGEEYAVVRDYNNYIEAIRQGAVKEETIIIKLRDGLTSIMIAIMFLMFLPIMSSMDKGESIFTGNSVKALRRMTVIMMLVMILPDIFAIIARAFTYAEYLMFRPSLKHFFMMMVASLIGVIAEMFSRGCELQEEIDMIA